MAQEKISEEKRNIILHQEIEKHKRQGYVVLEISLFAARMKRSLLNPIALRSLIIASFTLACIACVMSMIILSLNVVGVVVDVLIWIAISPEIILPAILILRSINQEISISVNENGEVSISRITSSPII